MIAASMSKSRLSQALRLIAITLCGLAFLLPIWWMAVTALRQQGHTAVVIQPIGFLCDHVEILYDIDIGFRNFAGPIGLEVTRPESLNDSPLLTAALEQLSREGFARLAAKTQAAPVSHPVPVV